MKICIIGSSNTASLKLGWETVKDQFPGVELIFFSSLGGTLRCLRVKDGKLVARDPAVGSRIFLTSGGHESIDPQNFGAFLIYGLKLSVPRLERGISLAVLKEVARNTVLLGLTEKIAGRLRQVTSETIWIGMGPMETTEDGVQEGEEFHSYSLLLDEMAAASEVPGTKMLAQPEETICPDLRTANRYGNFAARRKAEALTAPEDTALDVENLQGELKHMNADFGALWLTTNLPIIMGS